jgi:hypothetical protein
LKTQRESRDRDYDKATPTKAQKQIWAHNRFKVVLIAKALALCKITSRQKQNKEITLGPTPNIILLSLPLFLSLSLSHVFFLLLALWSKQSLDCNGGWQPHL